MKIVILLVLLLVPTMVFADEAKKMVYDGVEVPRKLTEREEKFLKTVPESGGLRDAYRQLLTRNIFHVPANGRYDPGDSKRVWSIFQTITFCTQYADQAAGRGGQDGQAGRAGRDGRAGVDGRRGLPGEPGVQGEPGNPADLGPVIGVLGETRDTLTAYLRNQPRRQLVGLPYSPMAAGQPVYKAGFLDYFLTFTGQVGGYFSSRDFQSRRPPPFYNQSVNGISGGSFGGITDSANFVDSGNSNVSQGGQQQGQTGSGPVTQTQK